MNTIPFFKAIRNSKNAEELIKRRPTAFALLYLIASRAKRSNDSNFLDLEIGEALIGDFKSYGVRSRQVYRSDLELLKSHQFLTIRTTNRGTIAKLIDTSIFDINPDTNQPSPQPSINHQATTNKNDKNGKNIYMTKNFMEKKEKQPVDVRSLIADLKERKTKGATHYWQENASNWIKKLKIQKKDEPVIYNLFKRYEKNNHLLERWCSTALELGAKNPVGYILHLQKVHFAEKKNKSLDKSSKK